MFVRFLIAATVSFLLTALGHYYLYVRLVEPLSDRAGYIWPSVLLGLWALTFFGFALARAVPVAARKVIEFAMFVWMGSAYVFLILCIMTSPLSLGLHFFGKSEAWLAVGLLSLSGVLILWSFWAALSHEVVVRSTLILRQGLPTSLSELRIVVLSDIHVAGLVGRRRMKRLAAKVNSMEPHLVFVIGDLVDGTVQQLKNEVKPLQDLSPSHGVYYVTGNHEYYCNAAKWRQYCAEVLGWNVLSNAHKVLQIGDLQLNIIGVEDRSSLHLKNGKRSADHRLETAIQGLSEQDISKGCNILLAHQPKDTRTLKHAPWIDVQVSGHTHGGQLWPLQLFVYSDQKYNKGAYTLQNGTQLYVTQGTGFWGPPMRLGTRCEISLLKLQPKSP